jgi:hypothetical protein
MTDLTIRRDLALRRQRDCVAGQDDAWVTTNATVAATIVQSRMTPARRHVPAEDATA